MSDVKIKVGADLDTRAVDAELAELTQKINAVGGQSRHVQPDQQDDA